MAQEVPFSFDGDWTPDRPMAAQVAALVQTRLEQGWALFQLLEAAVYGEVGLEPYTVPWLWFGAMMAEVEQRLKDTIKSRL